MAFLVLLLVLTLLAVTVPRLGADTRESREWQRD
jgi:hypothetical protein